MNPEYLYLVLGYGKRFTSIIFRLHRWCMDVLSWKRCAFSSEFQSTEHFTDISNEQISNMPESERNKSVMWMLAFFFLFGSSLD